MSGCVQSRHAQPQPACATLRYSAMSDAGPASHARLAMGPGHQQDLRLYFVSLCSLFIKRHHHCGWRLQMSEADLEKNQALSERLLALDDVDMVFSSCSRH